MDKTRVSHDSETTLDYEEWFLKAVDKGIADLDASRTCSTREVLSALAKQRNERAARKRKQTA